MESKHLKKGVALSLILGLAYAQNQMPPNKFGLLMPFQYQPGF